MGRETLNKTYSNTHTPCKGTPSSKNRRAQIELHVECVLRAGGNQSYTAAPYCQGEGWQFYETQEVVAIYRGVAPVYKPGVLATGQFPQATDTQRATGYIEVFRDDGSQTYPNYERYQIQTAKNYDKLYELKVDPEGEPVYGTTGYIRSAKWKVLSLVPWHGDQVSSSWRKQTSRARAGERPPWGGRRPPRASASEGVNSSGSGSSSEGRIVVEDSAGRSRGNAFSLPGLVTYRTKLHRLRCKPPYRKTPA